MKIRPPLVLLPLVLLLWGCATSGASDTSSRGSSRLITAEEAQQSGALNADEVIRRVRPQWLQAGGSTFRGGGDLPTVYMDGVRVEFSELRAVRTAMIQRLEFLSPTDATNRFGTNHTGGAILVVTRSD